MNLHHGLTLCLLTLLLPTSIHAQTKPATSPVGSWVAEHPSKGGLGSWWQFRADGTLTMYVGVIASSPYSLKGELLTQTGAGDNGTDGYWRVRFEGEKMYMKPQSVDVDGPETAYARIGVRPSDNSPIVGEWKNVTAVTPTGDSHQDSIQKIAVSDTLLFTADGTEYLRIPFRSAEGTWNARDQVFQVTSEPGTHHFDLAGGKLVLSQPPNDKATDTYLPDNMSY
jgi:hypothetical protein